MPSRLGVTILHALLAGSLGETQHPDLVIGVKHVAPPAKPRPGSPHPLPISPRPRPCPRRSLREPSVGALFCDGPVRADTRCVFHAPHEAPSAAQCEGAVPICVPAWPMAADGVSLDTEALRTAPLPQLLGAVTRAPPEGATEAAVAAVWAECLGTSTDELGRDSSFFDLGGTSMVWMSAVSRLNGRFQLQLQPMEVFDKAVLPLVSRAVCHV